MATIQRPVKTYGTRTYVAEVAAAPGNQDPILANEVDGDIDTIYSAWNGGADTVNIKDGAISRAKLSTTDVTPSLPPIPIATDANKTVVVNAAGNGLVLGTGGTFAGATPPATPQVGQLWWRSDPDGNLFIYYDDGNSKQFVPAVPSSVGPWSVSGATLTPTDATKTVALAPVTNALQWSAGLVKGRLIDQASGDIQWRVNSNAAGTQDDATKSSWLLRMGPVAGDTFAIYRAPAGTSVFQNFLSLDTTGKFNIPQNLDPAIWIGAGGSTTKAGLSCSGDWVQLHQNNPWNPEDANKPSWALRLNCAAGADVAQIIRRASGAAAGTVTASFQMDQAGGLYITGSVGQKASGTTWSNPSDPRLKKNITKYARGLSEILQLEPISYTLKQHDIDTCGFDAEQVRAVFPECVSTTKMKLEPDDEEETEVLTLDIHPILIALINAVKELANGRA